MNERDIFIAALQIDDEARRVAFLDEACGGSCELRKRVDALLGALDQAGSYLEQPAADPVATIDQPVAEKPGTQIGPYKLLQQIGEGGMGVVYMAEQTDPVERRVAVKIIKPGMDTRRVIARFEAERQALAMMDHPNIAKVLDAGTTESGRPYFVMELVKGVPITQYCDEKHLTPQERLRLFIPVCEAVQHAHQKGIIHRDLKPSNVMVAEYDDRAVPKIIDFGVAKAVEHRLTEKTLFTELGQVVGTFEYMSPEQAKLNQLDTDTRSDIYSLGVLLYELLVGDTPFDRSRLRVAAFDELLRIIREEEPPRPSVRLRTSATLPAIAANRRVEPKKLSALLHNELDWIVMTALDKDRTRRYQTAGTLAADITHYLQDEPVQACPPSAAYRFRKFARRNKVPLATGVLVALALVSGMVGTTWQMLRAIHAENLALARYEEAEAARQNEAQQRKLAEQQKRRALAAESQAKDEAAVANAVINYVNQDIFSQANPAVEKDRNITLRQVVDRASERIEGRFENQPRVEAELRLTLAGIYYELASYETAERHARKAVDLLSAQQAEDSQLSRFSAMDKLTNALFRQGKYAEAEAIAQEVLEGRRRMLGKDDPTTLTTWQRMAALYATFGRVLEAKQIWENIIRISREHSTSVPWTVLSNLASQYAQDGRYTEAEQFLREALRNLPLEHPDALQCRAQLASLLRDKGLFEEAEEQYRHVLDIQRTVLTDAHPNTEQTMMGLLDTVLFNRSSENTQLAVEVGQYLVRQHAKSVQHWARLAWAYYRDGSWQSCLDTLQVVDELRAEQQLEGRDAGGPLDAVLWRIRHMAAWQLGDHEQPESWQNQRHHGPRDPGIRFCRDEWEHLLLGLGSDYSRKEGLAKSQIRRQHYHEAAGLFESMVQTERAVLGEVNSVSVLTLYNLGLALRNANCPAEASNSFSNAMNMFLQLDDKERLVAATRISEATEDVCVLSLGSMRPRRRGELPTRNEILDFLESRQVDPQRKLQQLALAERTLQLHPHITEVGWKLDRAIGLRGAFSPRYHAGEDAIYVSRVATGPGTAHQNGLFRVDQDGLCRNIAHAAGIKGVGIHQQSGDVFYCEAQHGAVIRLSKQSSQPCTWVAAIRKADSDPSAIAFLSPDYVGTQVAADEAVLIDSGWYGSPKGVYRFSCAEPDRYELIQGDEAFYGETCNLKDIAVGRKAIYVATYLQGTHYNHGPGSGIVRFSSQSPPTRLHLDRDILDVYGLAWDPTTHNLLLFLCETDHGKHIVRWDPATGRCQDLIRNVFCETWMHASLDISSDGTKILVATPNTILVFTREMSAAELARAAEADALRRSAAAHVAEREWQQANDELLQASTLCPDSLQSWELRARAYLAVGDFARFELVRQEVMRQLQEVERYPVDYVRRLSWLWQRLSQLCQRADSSEASLALNTLVTDHLQARAESSSCPQVTEALPACYWARVMLLHNLGRHAEAVEDCRKAVSAAPTNPWFWRYQAVACLMADDRDGYHQTCLRLLDQFATTTNVDHRSIVVECCTLLPQPADVANRVLAFAERLQSSKTPVYQSSYARALLRANRPQEAADVFAKCVSNWEREGGYWNCWGDWFLLAIAHHRLGQTSPARRHYQDGIDWTTRHVQYAKDNYLWIDPYTLYRWDLFRQEAESLSGVTEQLGRPSDEEKVLDRSGGEQQEEKS